MFHRSSQPAQRTCACPAAYGPVSKKTSASKPMTSDGGNTWVDIVGKRIPQAPVNDIIRHRSKPKWLFVATDVGVFRTTNLGTT